jgi:hypothetical protein
VTVSAKNTGSSPIDLNATVVNLYDSDNVPGGEMTAKPADPLDGKLAPGKSAKGVYVFTVAKGKRDPVKITVTIGDAPVLVFTGKAP